MLVLPEVIIMMCFAFPLSFCSCGKIITKVHYLQYYCARGRESNTEMLHKEKQPSDFINPFRLDFMPLIYNVQTQYCDSIY